MNELNDKEKAALKMVLEEMYKQTNILKDHFQSVAKISKTTMLSVDYISASIQEFQTAYEKGVNERIGNADQLDTKTLGEGQEPEATQ